MRKKNEALGTNEQGLVNTKMVEFPDFPEIVGPSSGKKGGSPKKKKEKKEDEEKVDNTKTIKNAKSTYSKTQSVKMNKMTAEDKTNALADEIINQKNLSTEDGHILMSAISIAGVGSEFRKSIVSMSRDDIALVVQARFQIQATRLAWESRIRNQKTGNEELADIMGVEDDQYLKFSEETLTVPQWLYATAYNQEQQVNKMLDLWSSTTALTRWLRDITGVGPVFATIIATMFKIDIEHGIGCSANDFISYAGLNDHNTPWIGKVASTYVTEAYNALGLSAKDPATFEVCQYLANMKDKWGHPVIGKTAEKIYTQGMDPETGIVTKDSLSKSLARIPYNKNLKPIMYLISKSFVLNKNRGSKYGRLYAEYLEKITQKNENGDYADQAERYLNTKKWDKSTESYKAYTKGKLPNSQLVRRAQRYAVKIFINHVYEAMYFEKYGKRAPFPYILCYDPTYADPQHVHYITPEIDYIPYLTGQVQKKAQKSLMVTLNGPIQESTIEQLIGEGHITNKMISPDTDILLVSERNNDDKTQFAASVFGIQIMTEDEYLENGFGDLVRANTEAKDVSYYEDNLKAYGLSRETI